MKDSKEYARARRVLVQAEHPDQERHKSAMEGRSHACSALWST